MQSFPVYIGFKFYPQMLWETASAAYFCICTLDGTINLHFATSFEPA